MSLPVHLVASLGGVAVGDEVVLEGDEAHHAVAVRRMRVGERLVVTDGAGTAVTGEVASTAKRSLTLTVEHVRVDPAPQPAVSVVQALPKGERGELAVEVLTEVGVARVVPWAAARSVAVWKGERAEKSLARCRSTDRDAARSVAVWKGERAEKSLARWRSTAREAAKQARRSWFPRIDPLATTAEVLDLIRACDLALVLHEEATTALAGVEVPASGEVVLVVGPEGGLTDDEVAALVDAGAHAVRLGSEVLRTSTAGVVATAALLARTPRWA